MDKNYDVFISYRRSGGSAEARLVQTKLFQHDLKAFLDVDDLESGHFNLALLNRIAEAPNFVIILSPQSLDRTVNEGDWLRQEIAQAIKTERNIVPVIMPGFQFPAPETLPAEIRDLITYQSVHYSHDFFDATIGKLVQYLKVAPADESTSRPTRLRSLVKTRSSKFWLGLGIVAAIVMGLMIAASAKFWNRPPPRGQWTTFAPLPAARRSHMAAAIGTLLCVVGGVEERTVPTLEANNIADPNKGWFALPSLPQVGDSLNQHDFNLITKKEELAAMETWQAGRYQGTVAVFGGKLYVIGGWRTIPPYPSSLLHIYDPSTNTWSAGAPMPILSGCSSAGVIDGKIYVLSPCNGHTGYYDLLHVYDPVADKWADKDPAPHQHSSGAAGTIGGKLYVVGGFSGSGDSSSVLDVFDPATGAWSTKAPMPTPRGAMSGGVINGKLYVVGGINKKETLAVVEVYDPTTDTWSTETPIQTPRHDFACAVIDGKLYVVGGMDGQGNTLASVEVFTPPIVSASGR